MTVITADDVRNPPENEELVGNGDNQLVNNINVLNVHWFKNMVGIVIVVTASILAAQYHQVTLFVKNLRLIKLTTYGIVYKM